MSTRAAGLILHPTSLPGPFGIGDLGPEAVRFLDWAASAGQGLWQVLPLSPIAFADSPYAAPSAFAGNALLISPEMLLRDGFLPASAIGDAPSFPLEHVDFEAVIRWKESLLRRSWEHFRAHAGPEARGDMDAFAAAPEQAGWLGAWAMFAALKERFQGRPWTSWDRAIARREPGALAQAERELGEEIGYHRYLQFLFFRQWSALRSEAHARGIRILGDAPIYVAGDSADVWVNPHLFQLDDELHPKLVSGVPPDYFSEDGQLWGSPLYRWDRLEAEGFAWWIDRVRANLRLYDLLRIDHFRGFAGYWAVPAGEKTARKGRWLPGPGMKLFQALRAALGEMPIVAEDLGEITPDVRDLLREVEVPGMKVLQFAFSEIDSDHAPHRHPTNAVAYTGTHDNDTTRGWFAALDPEARARVLEYIGGDGREIEWDMIRACYTSVADRAVVPMQDVLGLGSEARMNTPSKTRGNWAWRLRGEALTAERAARLRRLAILSGRARE